MKKIITKVSKKKLLKSFNIEFFNNKVLCYVITSDEFILNKKYKSLLSSGVVC